MENLFSVLLLAILCFVPIHAHQQLRFNKKGEFRILQVADMHYANGKTTPCLDVLPRQVASCSDLNTTAFIQRLILAEKPDLIVFTGKQEKEPKGKKTSAHDIADEAPQSQVIEEQLSKKLSVERKPFKVGKRCLLLQNLNKLNRKS